MSYSDKYGNFFGIINGDGNVEVLHIEDGMPATRMDVNLYAVDSDGSKSVRYDHPDGIIISQSDADKIGLEIEQPK